MVKNKIFLDAFIIIILSNLANLINMIIQIILGKTLSYYDFSLYYSLVALISYFIIPAATIGIFLQKKFFIIVNKNINIGEFFFYSTKKIFIFFLLSFFIFLFFYKRLSTNFYHENFYTYLNFYLVLVLSIYMNWPISINQALKNYRINSIIYFFASILKLIIIILLFYVLNFNSFFATINVNIFYIFLLTFLYFLPNYKKIEITNLKSTIRYKILHDDFKFYAFYSLMIPIMLSSDIIIAKIYFSSEDSAKYIVASSLSKIIYFISSGLYSMIFNESLSLSKKNTIIITLISLIISSFSMFTFIYFGEDIIEVIYGKKFYGSHEYLLFLSLAVFMICLSKLMCDILISKGKYGFIKLQYISYAILIYLMIFQLKELSDLPKNVLLSSSCLFFFTLFYFIRNYYITLKK